MSVSIPVVIGTGRAGRQSENVARFVHKKIASQEGISASLIDIREHLVSPYTIPAWIEDKNASKWRKIASEAAGFVFVVPEYNRSFPGEFKLLFDSAFKEYKNKPVVIVGVSSGQYGGVRVIQQLMPVLLAAHMEVLGTTIATANVEKIFDNSGEVSDTKYVEFVDEAVKTLVGKVTK